jgi:Na+-translocating ferredoxin:NAD+ oxidoreductase RnfG subunit
MRRSVSTSDIAALVFALAITVPGLTRSAALTTADEALARAFPGAKVVEKKTAFLTDADAAKVTKEAGTPPGSKLVTYYVARTDDGSPAGYGYLDTHLVRTLQETVLVLVGPDGVVRRVEVIAFSEPRDYLPSERWLRQFDGREFGADLAPNRGIRTLAGATLSSRAVTECVRRVLALHRRLAAATP